MDPSIAEFIKTASVAGLALIFCWFFWQQLLVQFERNISTRDAQIERLRSDNDAWRQYFLSSAPSFPQQALPHQVTAADLDVPEGRHGG
jgi:hypothetical protein